MSSIYQRPKGRVYYRLQKFRGTLNIQRRFIGVRALYTALLGLKKNTQYSFEVCYCRYEPEWPSKNGEQCRAEGLVLFVFVVLFVFCGCLPTSAPTLKAMASLEEQAAKKRLPLTKPASQVGKSAGHVVVTAAQHRRDGKCNCPGCRVVLGNQEKYREQENEPDG
jgi:hypothetical protein